MQILSICSSKAFTIVLLLHYCVPSVSDERCLTAKVLRLLATRLQFLGKEAVQDVLQPASFDAKRQVEAHPVFPATISHALSVLESLERTTS